MKPEELRIGNWVYQTNQVFNEEPHRVNRIMALADLQNSKCMVFEEWDNVKGIPLTEEWLLKFGFEPHKGGYELEKSTFDKTYMLVDVLTDQCVRADISYVHSLQNLYYALTGEELKIKN